MTTTTDVTTPAELLSPAGGTQVASRSAWQLFWARFREDKVALVGRVVIVHPHLHRDRRRPDRRRRSPATRTRPRTPRRCWTSSASRRGRTTTSGSAPTEPAATSSCATMYGARTSLIVGSSRPASPCSIGLVVGLIAGFFGGWSRHVLSRVARRHARRSRSCSSRSASSPRAAPARRAASHGLIQPGLRVVIAVIALFTWPYIARIVRGYTLSLREREFVEASRSLGASNTRIIFREILPNLVGPMIVYTTLLDPAGTSSSRRRSRSSASACRRRRPRGAAPEQARSYYDVAWWLMLFPGLFLVITTLAFNLLGDGLRDALDVRADR